MRTSCAHAQPAHLVLNATLCEQLEGSLIVLDQVCLHHRGLLPVLGEEQGGGSQGQQAGARDVGAALFASCNSQLHAVARKQLRQRQLPLPPQPTPQLDMRMHMQA